MLLTVTASSGTIRVHSDAKLPYPVPDFAEAISKLAGDSGERGAVLDVRIRYNDDCDKQWRQLTRTYVAPSAGILAQLPPHPSIEIAVSRDGNSIGLRWIGGGIVHGVRQGNAIDIICEPDGPDGAWLIRYILATTLVLWGDTDVCHGCLVRWNGKNVMFCGPSGSGKSSLSLLFALSGGGILTEDITYINSGGQAAPVTLREVMTLRPGTFKAFNTELTARLGPGCFGASKLPAGRGGTRIELSSLLVTGETIPVAVDLMVFPSLRATRGELAVKVMNDRDEINLRCFQRDSPEMINWIAFFMKTQFVYRTTGNISDFTRAVQLSVSLDYHHRFEDLLEALGL